MRVAFLNVRPRSRIPDIFQFVVTPGCSWETDGSSFGLVPRQAFPLKPHLSWGMSQEDWT
jgi:hypothetical protein